MQPSEICQNILGAERLAELLAQLSSPQVKAVLKEGGLKAKLPGSFSTQKKRRSAWSNRINAALAEGNDAAASELLQQWLLNHERQLLVDYLEALGVPHRAGETDESFLFSKAPESLREQATKLMDSHTPEVVVAYIAYIAFQQKSHVFDDWAPLAAYGARAEATQEPAQEAATQEPASGQTPSAAPA